MQKTKSKNFSEKILIGGFLCLLSCSTIFAQSGTRGFVLKNDLSESGTSDFYDNSYAIIVGIDDYQDPAVTDLHYASADAISIREMLIRKFNYKEENVHFFLNEKATRSNIMSALSSFSTAEKNSQVIFYFAGHGETISLPNGGDMGVLLTYDTFVDNLYATGLRMKEISDITYMIAAKHQLFLVDACYGGLATVSTRSLSSQSQRYLSHLLNADARQIITAGGKEEQVIEKAIWGHSAFTKVLLDALDKELGDLDRNGLITAEELAAYMKPRVFNISEGAQQPIYNRFTSDEGDFVFALEDISTETESKNEPIKAPDNTILADNSIPSDNLTPGEWIDKMANALLPGGPFDGNLVFEADNLVQTPQGEMAVGLKQTHNFQNEKLISEVSMAMGKVTMQVEKGEGKMTMGGNEIPMQPQQMQQVKSDLHRNYIYLAINRKALDVEYLGMAEVDGDTYAHLRINGEMPLNLYLDQETNLPTIITYQQENSQEGGPVSVKIVADDWRERNGVRMAYESVSYIDDEKTAKMTVKSHSVD